MKSVSTALKNHLAQTVTTLATCWLIQRLDGTTFAFTSHDADLTVSAVTYKSIAGFSRSSITTGSTGQVDDLTVIGFFVAGEIVEQDLINGLFDYASVSVFVVNWADLTMGICRMRFGWLGETVRSPEGIFQAELRGLTQALVQEMGTAYQPICRADLGDSKCKIPIAPPKWQPDAVYAAGTYVQAATQSSDALLQAIFLTEAGGTSGGTEPTWQTTIGFTTTDGTVAWVSKPYWRIVGTVNTVASTKQFTTTTPLAFPAAPNSTPAGMVVPGSVAFIGNVAGGTIINISDGTNSNSYTLPYDSTPYQATYLFEAWLNSVDLGFITYTVSNTVFYFTNSNPAGGGSISKEDDTQQTVVIEDFTDNPVFGGAVTWLTGNNAGRSMEVKTWDSGSSTITLWLNMYFPIQPGDKFLIYPGCDKTRPTCFYLFNNILNFRAEPDMPGLDTVLIYPQQ